MTYTLQNSLARTIDLMDVFVKPAHKIYYYHIHPVIAKARYTLVTKLNSTRSALLKLNEIDRVALAPYTLATKSKGSSDIRATESTVSATKSTVLATMSTELATMSTATSCRIQVVADLSPKPATKSTGVYRA